MLVSGRQVHQLYRGKAHHHEPFQHHPGRTEYRKDRLPEKQSWNHIAILDTKTDRISVEQDLYAIETAEKFKQKKGFCKDGRFNGREVVIAWMPFPEPPISKQVTSLSLIHI